MAVLTHSMKLYILRISILHKFDDTLAKLLPRPCMLASASLVVSGLSIPILMAAGLLQLLLSLFGLGLVLVAAGCISGLIRYGEL